MSAYPLFRCGHSKKFLPIYEEISDEFEAYNNDNDNDNEVEDGVMKEKKKTTTTKRKLNDFVFAKVDCVKETSLYSSEHIEHFPSIKTYLAGGEGVMYEVSQAGRHSSVDRSMIAYSLHYLAIPLF